MNIMKIIGNIFGGISLVAGLCIYQQKTRKNVLLFKLMQDVLSGLQYLFLSAGTGVAIALVAMTREITFYIYNNYQEKKYGYIKNDTPIWLLIPFLCLSILSAVFTWKNVYSILPAIASFCGVISFWQKKPSTTRKLSFPISICMFSYDVVNGAYLGMVNEILTVSSSIIGIIRNDRKQDNKVEATDEK